MLCKVYILFSPSHKRYYTGITNEPNRRLVQHHKGINKSTCFADDWLKVYSTTVNNYAFARVLEKRIKQRGAGRFLIEQGIVIPLNKNGRVPVAPLAL